MSVYQPFPHGQQNIVPQPAPKSKPEDSADPCEQPQPSQAPLDLIDEASMESFPCSDPPSYTRCHA